MNIPYITHHSKQNIKSFMRPLHKFWRTKKRSHTIQAKTKAIAKRGPPKPSWNPMAAARAVTTAEWDDGIPPDATNCFISHLLSLNLHYLRNIKGGLVLIEKIVECFVAACLHHFSYISETKNFSQLRLFLFGWRRLFILIYANI